MNSLLKKFLKQVDSSHHKAKAKKPDEDFNPYVCHYDPNTILTKNGELLQIIRITGFNDTALASQIASLRDSVRESIVDHVKDNKVAFWLNTIRRKKNINPGGKHQGIFSEALDQAWVKKHKWDDQYVNELYITVIVEGFDTSIGNMKSFARSFSYLATKSLHHKFLRESKKRLAEIVANVRQDTQEYGSRILGIRDWGGDLYSEPMRFFGKICNLYEERYPLAANDISSDLSGHRMAFGDRQMEVIGEENKNFAAILSLKEYFEVSTSSLDRILQLPFEFIITQSFDFAFEEKELEPFEYQNYILKVSGDESFRHNAGIANFIENKKDSTTDYGKLQTTIMIIADSKSELEKDVAIATAKFSSLGLVTVREDLFLEHCFWSQLPGNFRYLARQKLVNTNSVAGFAALHNYPLGTISGNKWGPAVTVFKTVLNTPYFFNFHEGSSGHSMFIGVDYYENMKLVNFLLAQSDKLSNRIFHFDFGDISKCFVNACEGNYYNLVKNADEDTKPLLMNPLLLENNDKNEKFLREFFQSLVAFTKEEIPEEETNIIPEIIQTIIASKASNIKEAIECFNNPKTPTIYKNMKIWGGEKYGHIFGSKTEIDWSSKMTGFNLTENLRQKPILIPTVLYLLHKIEASLDGSPTVIVLNEACELFDNIIISPKFIEFLDNAKEQNCIVILTSTSAQQICNSEIIDEIRERLSLEVFLPNHKLKDACIRPLGLTEEEADIIRSISSRMGHFLFKQGDDSVIASLDFKDMVEFSKVLAADETTLTAMKEVMATNSEFVEVTDEASSLEKSLANRTGNLMTNQGFKKQALKLDKTWVTQLLEVLKAIEDERATAEKRKTIADAAEQRRILKKKLGQE